MSKACFEVKAEVSTLSPFGVMKMLKSLKKKKHTSQKRMEKY